MAWSRQAAAAALYQVIATTAGETAFVHVQPPMTLNPPCIIIGYPSEVRYTTFAFGVDEATLPILCIGPIDGPDVVDSLIAIVRSAIGGPDLTLGGVVACVGDTVEHNWRAVNVAGIDVLQAEVSLTIQM